MKVFELGYKAYCHQIKEWYADYIRADNKADALRIFARRHGIMSAHPATEWRWQEGDWYMKFAYVKPVRRVPCSHCDGRGLVSVSA